MRRRWYNRGMNRNAFRDVAAVEGCTGWEELTSRPAPLYSRRDEIRSPFARDYTRILHSTAFRRLKHKTQVFYNVDNDHVCTRLEHVAHVESVADTIAKYLGLNDELTRAISFGHDLGHAPFGHHGERILDKLCARYGLPSFWHERGGLRLVDDIELLADDNNNLVNLNLTYAVRDGIISHCGEVDENGLFPRGEFIDLAQFDSVGKYSPATWEGCVVKVADKIAYIGRDIEDAAALGFLDAPQTALLEDIAKKSGAVNTTVIIHGLISDICANSTPQRGIRLSDEACGRLNAIKDFNYKNIYSHPRFDAYQRYAELVLTSLSDVLLGLYTPGYAVDNVIKAQKDYPLLCSSFASFVAKLCSGEALRDDALLALSQRCRNKKIYGRLNSDKLYAQAVMDFISGMTDKFAVRVYGELLTY